MNNGDISVYDKCSKAQIECDGSILVVDKMIEPYRGDQ